jgi:hypothetical protein
MVVELRLSKVKNMNNGRKRTVLMESVMSTPKDIKPSIDALEDNSQLEFIKRWRKVAQEITKVYEDNPPIYKGSVLSFPEWTHDGCNMEPYWVKLYDYPARIKIQAILDRERKSITKDLFGLPEIYNGPDLADIEKDMALNKNGQDG